MKAWSGRGGIVHSWGVGPGLTFGRHALEVPRFGCTQTCVLPFDAFQWEMPRASVGGEF